MVEKICPVEILLRHASVFLIQETKVAMDINHRRHYSLAGQIHSRCATRNLHFALSSNRRKSTVIDDERRVLDRRFSVAHDQPRAFEESRATGPLLECQSRDD